MREPSSEWSSTSSDEGFAPPRPELVSLAARIPPNLKLGTATWACEGWAGDVYHRHYTGRQPLRRLEEYVRYPLFRSIGINSAFYERPSERVLESYARVLPSGFACVIKVWDRITARRFARNPRWGTLAGELNPDFLSAQLFTEAVHRPYTRIFRRQVPYFVFEFQAMRGADLPRPEQWATQLDEFFAALPRDARYAVELRNRELLTTQHGEVLRRHGVAHVLNSWTDMPPIGAQADLPWALAAEFTVVRALMKPGRRYEQAVQAFAPFDRVREVVPELRTDLLRVMSAAVRLSKDAVIHVNNRAEGSAPGTIRALAEALQT